MSMSTGMSTLGSNTGNFKPSIIQGKSKGGMTPFSQQQFTPEQMELFQSMFGKLGPDSYLSRLAGGDQSMFEQLEAPAMRQFGGLQGQLASRFSGMGSGARRSSGFQNTMNQATSDFAQDLQSQRMGLQRQAMGDLMGFSNQLMQQRPYDQFITEKKQPFWKRLLTGLAGPGIQGAVSGGSQAMLSGGGKSPSGFSQWDSSGNMKGGGGGGTDMASIAMKILPFIV